MEKQNKKYVNLFCHTQQIQSAQKSEEIYGDMETPVTKIIEREKTRIQRKRKRKMIHPVVTRKKERNKGKRKKKKKKGKQTMKYQNKQQPLMYYEQISHADQNPDYNNS